MPGRCAVHGPVRPAGGHRAPGLRQARRRHPPGRAGPAGRAVRARRWPTACRVRRLSAAEAREYEPHVAAVAALHVAEHRRSSTTARCARPWSRRLRGGGADLRLGAEVLGAARGGSRTVGAQHRAGTSPPTRWSTAPACTSDRVARRLGGLDPTTRIVPFRGEYYELRPERRAPRAGPDLPGARPAASRSSACTSPGCIHGCGARRPQRRPRPRPRGLPLAARRTAGDAGRHAGLAGVLAARGPQPPRRRRRRWRRSVSRRLFAQSLRRLVPELARRRPRPGAAGRAGPGAAPRRHAWSTTSSSSATGHAVHVLNAPSPAATSALEIARHVVSLLD